MFQNNKGSFFSYIFIGRDSFRFENQHTVKNMIDTKSVIKTVVSTGFLVISFVLLHQFTDPKFVPFELILGVAVFTMYLVKFAQCPEIQEFFLRKLSQKTTNFKENLMTFKIQILKLIPNQVGVQNFGE